MSNLFLPACDIMIILMNEMACRFVHESRRILVAESDIFLAKSVRIIFIPLTSIYLWEQELILR